jgi:hypothetical protein
MSFNGVLCPGHIQIRVTDLALAVRHYAEVIGLEEVLRGAPGTMHAGSRFPARSIARGSARSLKMAC